MTPSKDLHHNAALIIQKAWRRYLFRTVFEFYKQLVSLYSQRDPQMILRTVNPREGELLDAAAGVFIRFRLGGIMFPPSIYYKIFTYRPIVDLCASSPRMYAESSNRLCVLQHKDEVDRSGWYRRTENNNWRLFSSMMLPNGETDCEENKMIDFHNTKLQRQQDVRRWRKKKKTEWLRQMYARGRSERLGQGASLVESSTQEVLSGLGNDAEEIMEWEVDELLAWSGTLNLEEYMTQWKHLACSQPSEMCIGPFHTLPTEEN